MIGAVALAGTTLASFAGSSHLVEPGEPPRSIDAALPESDASLPRYRVVAECNLFMLTEKPVEVPVEQPIVESKLQIQLLGTLAAAPNAQTGESKEGSLAIVRDTNGAVVTLTVGDAFAEQRAKLVRIEPRRIVLEQSGRLEAVL